MNTHVPIQNTPSQKSSSSLPIWVRSETKEKLASLLNKLNDKQLGRRVRADEVVAFALDLINESQIATLQNATLSNADRLELKFRQYVRRYGKISKDEFLGRLINDKLED